jgi:hypothetical protein
MVKTNKNLIIWCCLIGFFHTAILFADSTSVKAGRKPQIVIVEIGQAEQGINGVGLGSAAPIGSFIVNCFYDPPADKNTPFFYFDQSNYNPADGTLRTKIDQGKVICNLAWTFPCYKFIKGTIGLGLVTSNTTRIYQDNYSGYYYGATDSRQSLNILGGLTLQPLRNLSVSCTYHLAMGWVATLDYYWYLNNDRLD